MKVDHHSNYRKRRAQEYPPIHEQLDALWKGGAAAEEMRQRILAIKERYPKDGRGTTSTR